MVTSTTVYRYCGETYEIEPGWAWRNADRRPFDPQLAGEPDSLFFHACEMHGKRARSRLQTLQPNELRRLLERYMEVVAANVACFKVAYWLVTNEAQGRQAPVAGLVKELERTLTVSTALVLTVVHHLSAEPDQFMEVLDVTCWLADSIVNAVEELRQWYPGDTVSIAPCRLNLEQLIPEPAWKALEGLAQGYRTGSIFPAYPDDFEHLDYVDCLGVEYS